MAISIKHKFQSTVPDGSHPTMLQPSNWNESHDITGAVLTVNGAAPDVDGNIALQRDLTGLQETLTAGTNITIVDNVISSSGGGVSDHEALTGLQGGTTGQHTHLTTVEYDWLYGQLPTSTFMTNGTITLDKATLDTNGHPAYLDLITHIGNSTEASVVIDSSAFVDGDMLRFLEIDNTAFTINLGTSYINGMVTGVTEITAVNQIGNAGPGLYYLNATTYYLYSEVTGDYVVLAKVNSNWSLTQQSFIGFMQGQLAWSKVDKTGATAADVGAEPSLPSGTTGQVLSTTTEGVRSWIDLTAKADKSSTILTDTLTVNTDALVVASNKTISKGTVFSDGIITSATTTNGEALYYRPTISSTLLTQEAVNGSFVEVEANITANSTVPIEAISSHLTTPATNSFNYGTMYPITGRIIHNGTGSVAAMGGLYASAQSSANSGGCSFIRGMMVLCLNSAVAPIVTPSLLGMQVIAYQNAGGTASVIGASIGANVNGALNTAPATSAIAIRALNTYGNSATDAVMPISVGLLVKAAGASTAKLNITNAYGVCVGDPTSLIVPGSSKAFDKTTGTVVFTNTYGLYIDISAGINKWNIYCKDTTATSWIAGKTLMGGAGTFATTATLEVAGDIASTGVITAITATATSLALTSEHHTVVVSADCTITLPAAASHSGRVYVVKKVYAAGAGVVVEGYLSETIDGTTTCILTSQYESLTIQSDGAAWWVI